MYYDLCKLLLCVQSHFNTIVFMFYHISYQTYTFNSKLIITHLVYNPKTIYLTSHALLSYYNSHHAYILYVITSYKKSSNEFCTTLAAADKDALYIVCCDVNFTKASTTSASSLFVSKSSKSTCSSDKRLSVNSNRT